MRITRKTKAAKRPLLRRRLVALFVMMTMLMSYATTVFAAMDNSAGPDGEPELGIVVIFNPNGGQTIYGHETRTTRTGDANSGTIGAGYMPEPPTHPGVYRFVGWTMVQNSIATADRFTGSTVVNAPGITVFALWGHQVTFHGGGGALNIINSPGSLVGCHGPRLIVSGQSIGSTPGVFVPNAPNHPGHTFAGWFIDNDPARPFTAATVVNGDLEVHARWEEIPRHTVTFDVQGGQLSTELAPPAPATVRHPHSLTRTAVQGRSVEHSSRNPYFLNQGIGWPRSAPEVLPAGPTAGMTLEGWWTQPNGWNGTGDRWAPAGVLNLANESVLPQPGGAATTVVTEDITVFANWVYRVTFHPNVGYMNLGHANSLYDAGFPNPRVADVNRNHFRDLTVQGGTINANGQLYNRNSNTAQPVGMPADNIMIRPGFIFMGWWNMQLNPSVAMGNEPPEAQEFLGTTPVNTSKTVYARWIPRTHVTITFDTNNGQWVADDTDDRYVNLPSGAYINNYGPASMPAMPLVPPAPGYMFAGWFVCPDGTGDRFTPSTQVPDDITVYARWLPYITLAVCTNGGTSNLIRYRNFPVGVTLYDMNLIWRDHHGPPTTTGAQLNLYDLVWMGNSGVTTRPGHHLNAPQVWNTAADGNGDLFTRLMPITQDMAVNGVFTIYAQWAITVIFNDNRSSIGAGTNEDDNILGRNAAGVNTAAHRTQVLLGRSFENNHLHPNTHPSTHPASPNFPMIGRMVSPQDTILDLTFSSASINTFVRGWNTQPDGLGEWFYHDTIITSGPLTLYGIWSETLAFHPGVAPPSAIPYGHRLSPITPFTPGPLAEGHFANVDERFGGTDPQWPGFTFVGWSDQLNGGVGSQDIIPGMPRTFPFTIYAQWHALLWFDATGGMITPDVGPAVPEMLSSARVFVPLAGAIVNTPARQNWQFAEWNTNRWGLRDDDGLVYNTGTVVTVTRDNRDAPINGERLFAQWAANIRFDEGDALVAGGVGTLVGYIHDIPELGNVVDHNMGLMPVPTHRPGYTFTGWEVWDYSANGGAGGYVPFTQNTVITDNMRFVTGAGGGRYIHVIARYTDSIHTLTIQNESNDPLDPFPATPLPTGQTAPTSQIPFNQSVTLAPGTKTGWTFLGWRLLADPAGVATITGTQLPHAFNMPDANRTYVAVWSRNVHTLTITNESNDTLDPFPASPTWVTTQTASGQVPFDQSVTLAPGSVAGWTFLGWRLPADPAGVATITVPPAHQFYMPDANKAYVAVWSRNVHTLTIQNHPAGVVLSTTTPPPLQTTSGSRPFDQSITLEPGYAPGWTFLGWVRVNHGDTFTPPTTIAGLLPANHQFNMPDANVTFVAIWGNDDDEIGIPNSFTLTISNHPTTVTPTDQTLSGSRLFGQDIVLEEGTVTGWTFVGWRLYGTNDAPVLDRAFTMPANNVHYVAVWEVNTHTLTITNDPAAHNFPATQTPTGPRDFGANITLVPGAVEGWTFIGWRLHGTNNTPVLNRTFTMPDNDVHYVAVWRLTTTDDGTTQNGPTTGFPETTGPVERPEREPEPEPEPEPVVKEHHAYIIGFEDGYVRPRAHVTRAQVATIFFRLISDADREHYWMQTNPFPDVVLENWFNNAVSTTTNADMFTGMPDGTFQPNRAITRAELTAVVVRFMGVTHNGTTPMFNDIAGHWAERYINIAAHHGWVFGYEGLNGRFLPDQPITRAETAAIINRMLGRLPETPADLLPNDMRIWPDNMNTNTWYYLYIQEATNSHYYVRKADGIHETWVQMLVPERPWVLLERPESVPQDIFRVMN
ncbi:MAG: InlB B-repeat-containing protein [Defluviitaleaceae bacterium]|nr:InlB B-repeat-containing protein [Defluviitaleaceae bacterium]